MTPLGVSPKKNIKRWEITLLANITKVQLCQKVQIRVTLTLFPAFLSSADFFQNQLFQKILSEI